MSILGEIKQLYDQHLYSAVVSFGNIIMPSMLSDKVQSIEKLEVLMCYAKSLYKTGEVIKAENTGDQFIQMRAAMLEAKSEDGKNLFAERDFPPEEDAYYLIHKCKLYCNNPPSAISILEKIPVEKRSARIHMALGILYKESGLRTSAIDSYKAVLKQNPMALAAALSLLSLDVKVSDIPMAQASFMEDKFPEHAWMANFLTAHKASHENKPNVVFDQLKPLPNEVKDNPCTVYLKAKMLYIEGEYKQAILEFHKHRALETKVTSGVDMMAAIYYKLNMKNEFDALMIKLSSINLKHDTKMIDFDVHLIPAYANNYAEVLVAYGYYALMTDIPKRAAGLAERAVLLAPREVIIEALILRGKAYVKYDKVDVAMTSFREILKLNKLRFEGHEGMLECLVISRRFRETFSQASSCSKTLSNPRAHTLYAETLFKYPDYAQDIKKAKSLLDEALSKNKFYAPAIFLYVEILVSKDSNFKIAIDMLLKLHNHEPSSHTHTLLGELYAKKDELDVALEHFEMALHMDSSNRRAKEGMDKIDPPCAGGGPRPGPYDASTALTRPLQVKFPEPVEYSDSDNDNEPSVHGEWSDPEFI